MIKIMVDSSSDCKADQFDYFMPINIELDGKEYKDGINIEHDEFYQLLTHTDSFPRTSQPSPDDFIGIFKDVKESGDELIYFALSSALSGTYQSATIAKQIVGYDRIHIFDTKMATHSIGLYATYAKKLAEECIDAETIIEKCHDLRDRTKLFAGVDTLDYLQKGGRIGKASALIGSLAKIKPIITVSSEGIVDVAGKALGFVKAVQTITDKVKSFELDPDFPIISLYTYGEENCEKLEKKLADDGYTVADRKQVGTTIGAHVGPGVYGVIFVTK